MTTYRQSDPQPAATVTTETPLRPSALQSEVMVPFTQTLITAIIIAAGLAFGAWRWGWSWDLPGIGFFVTLIVVWGWRLVRSDSLMWMVERLTKRDWSGDGVTGKPTLTTLNPDAARKTAAQAGTLRDVALARAQLTAFVYLCASVDEPTEKELGIPTGDREGYVKYRDKLIDLGIGCWNNPQRHAAGWHLAVDTVTAARIIEQHII